MMTVSNQQMNQLKTQLESRFVRDAARSLAAQFPGWQAGANEEEAGKYIRSGINKAKRFKILRPEDVMVFLSYMAAFGDNFEQQAEHQDLKKVLMIRNLNGLEKISRMLDRKQPVKNP